MLISFFRTVFLYLVLILSIRLMGKRQIGQMEAPEFVVTMLAANLASIPMQDSAISLLSGLAPLLTVLALELVLASAILKSVRLRRLLCGKPVILIDNGQILRENLRSARITLDELTGHLRQKDVLDIRTVQYAILETDGNLSVFPFPREKPASARDAGIRAREQALSVTIIEDGAVNRENLARCGLDRQWLARELGRRGAKIEDTLLLTVDRRGKTGWIGREAP